MLIKLLIKFNTKKIPYVHGKKYESYIIYGFLLPGSYKLKAIELYYDFGWSALALHISVLFLSGPRKEMIDPYFQFAVEIRIIRTGRFCRLRLFLLDLVYILVIVCNNTVARS